MRPSAALCLLVFCGPVVADELPPLATSAQLKRAVAGNTIEGSMDGSGRYTEYYRKDGRVKGADYQARWSIEGNTMCWVYTGQPKDCWNAAIKGANIKWVKDGKVQGSGTILKGNPNRF